MANLIQRLLAHPLTRGLDIDAPETTALRRRIVTSKPFLRRVYLDWYADLADRIPPGPEPVLEIGAGGGFFRDIEPTAISSEVFLVPGVDLVADATMLPIRSASLRAVIMTNVFHHISDTPRFLGEAHRVLISGGCIAMIEPWNTPWSEFVHRRFHGEDFLPDVGSWEFESAGPVSGANAALPWIVTSRDRQRLERDWGFSVEEIKPMMPLRYILSGGVSLRALQPAWSYPLWRWIDSRRFLLTRFALLSLIVIRKT